jgi:RNA polymerase sigma-70 factor, ECF subfamily
MGLAEAARIYQDVGVRPSSSSDTDLVALVQSGITNAYSGLYKRHFEVVKAAMLRQFRDDDIAYEATQEGFINGFRKIRTYDGSTATFKTWITRICINRAIDIVRRRREIIGHEEDVSLNRGLSAHSYASEPQDAVAMASIMDKRRALQEAVASLTEEQYLVFQYRVGEERSLEEVADLLDIPEGTVGSRLHAARDALALYMDKHHPDLIPESYQTRLEKIRAKEREALERRRTRTGVGEALSLEERALAFEGTFNPLIEALPPKQRAVALCRLVYGFSIKETAEYVGISGGSVSSNLAFAKKRLAQEKDKIEAKRNRAFGGDSGFLANYDSADFEAVLAAGILHGKLTKTEQHVAYLAFFRGYSHEETSKRLLVDQTYVSNVMYRAMKKLREYLTDTPTPNPTALHSLGGLGLGDILLARKPSFKGRFSAYSTEYDTITLRRKLARGIVDHLKSDPEKRVAYLAFFKGLDNRQISERLCLLKTDVNTFFSSAQKNLRAYLAEDHVASPENVRILYGLKLGEILFAKRNREGDTFRGYSTRYNSDTLQARVAEGIVQRLSEREQQVAYLVFFEGKTYKDIIQELRSSSSSVGRYYFSGLRKIRAHLEQDIPAASSDYTAVLTPVRTSLPQYTSQAVA